MLWITVLLLSAVFPICLSAQSYLNEIERATTIRIESGGFVFERLDLGKAEIGENTFSIRVTNSTELSQGMNLHLVANPGMSVPPHKTEKQFAVGPHSSVTAASIYYFGSLSPFGKLQVRIFKIGEEESPLFEARFHIGAENPSNKFDISKFQGITGQHLRLHYLDGTLAAKQSKAILYERENGISKMEKLIGSDFKGKIDVFLYPDMESKKADTLHIGDGYAFDSILVEVYNTDVQLDPYHEIAHILMRDLGSPPPLFDEGFAVYVAETLGADALKYVGSPGKKIDEVARELKEKERLIPLVELLKLTNIGDTPERSAIEYPQSASFVKFLIQRFGIQTFRRIVSSTTSGNEPEVAQRDTQLLETITGKGLAQLESEWLTSLTEIKSE